jgi:tRNA (uracil-5-)-methyltransferase TRM9
MDSATAVRLIELNKLFYQTFGPQFASTRNRLQPGVQRLLGTLNGDETILDLGCGSGALGRELARRGHRGAYLGLDFSPALLEEARRRSMGAALSFRLADLTSLDWDGSLPAASFDLVFAFAVLHHIPGMDLRLSILCKTQALLRKPGRFVHSEWQFLNSAKLKMRIQPWEQAGFSSVEVEPGDCLLDWRQGGTGLRYVHAFAEAELAALAAASRFEVQETFHSDGKEGNLSLYQIWNKLPEAAGG